jgi:hypothetical protein
VYERDATKIATAYAHAHFAGEGVQLRALPGVELDDRDQDRAIWNVVFRSRTAPARDPRGELWVVVDAVAKTARQFQRA